MIKRKTLFDILMDVSELNTSVERAEKVINKMFTKDSSLNLQQLENELDKQLGKETRVTLTKWINEKRKIKQK